MGACVAPERQQQPRQRQSDVGINKGRQLISRVFEQGRKNPYLDEESPPVATKQEEPPVDFAVSLFNLANTLKQEPNNFISQSIKGSPDRQTKQSSEPLMFSPLQFLVPKYATQGLTDFPKTLQRKQDDYMIESSQAVLRTSSPYEHHIPHEQSKLHFGEEQSEIRTNYVDQNGSDAKIASPLIEMLESGLKLKFHSTSTPHNVSGVRLSELPTDLSGWSPKQTEKRLSSIPSKQFGRLNPIQEVNDAPPTPDLHRRLRYCSGEDIIFDNLILVPLELPPDGFPEIHLEDYLNPILERV